MPLRFPLLFACLAASALAAETTAPMWPLWDGHESIEQYAKRTNLPPTKTLDLGNSVNLELALIPAGKFVMGTPEPVEPKEDAFTGQMILVLAGAAAFALVVIIGVRSIHKRRRPQFSLRWLLVFVITLGIAMFGAFRWRDVARARVRYEAAQSYCSPYERPTHQVTLTTPFYMGKCEATQEQYMQSMGANPSHFRGAGLPVEQVSWFDAQQFCGKVGEKTGLVVQLPTEAQWEFACRSGTTTKYFSGDTDADLARVAWCATNSGGRTHPVGQKEPNAFGLHDMHGNVWEWCRDSYEQYKRDAAIDPLVPPQSDDRVLRGGSWDYFTRDCRSAGRVDYYPGSTYFCNGFRVVVEAPPRTP